MKKCIFLIIIFTLVLFTEIVSYIFLSKGILLSSDLAKDIDKYWGTKVEIRDVRDFNIYGQNFKLILSTKPNNNNYKSLNVYQEKFNGLYYKSTIASE